MGEEVSWCRDIACCSWCVSDARGLHPEEVSALVALEQIAPRFQIWSSGRREDSPVGTAKNEAGWLPEPQPARIFPGLRLYIGDMDDAADVQHLKELGIGCVVNLCGEKIAQRAYENVPLQLAYAGIHQHILPARDQRNFDIIEIAGHAFGAIEATLTSSGPNNGVLIHCWGGVNRSAAVAIAFLTVHHGVPLFAAIDHAMAKRGTILTNQSFRTQLVRNSFKKGLTLESSDVPAVLLTEGAVDSTELDACPLCSDPGNRHRRGSPKDTAVYGLLYAARDGCLKCVKQYIEEDGVDPKSRSNTWQNRAEDWAQWELTNCRMEHKRLAYGAILSYLSGAEALKRKRLYDPDVDLPSGSEQPA